MQPFYDLVPRDPKRQVPLANNEQIRVAPGDSTPNPKAGHALGSDSSVWPRSGLVSPIYQGTSLAHQCGPAEELCLRWPELFENYWQLTSTHTVSNGKSAWATSRNV